MTTSGEYLLDLTANDIFTEALDILQAVGDGETLSGDSFNRVKRSCNMMLKLWETQGIHLWTYTEYFMFFVKGQAKFDLTDPLTRVVNEFSSTALGADAVATDTQITVDSTAGMKLGQAIGVMDNTNELFWTVIEAIPSGLLVNLRDALLEDSSGIVRFYDTADLVQTTAAAGQVATDTEVQLATTVGFVPDMIIQITQDDATVLHTTINSIDYDTDIATINDALTDAVTIGNDIVAYTSEQNFIPFSRILNDMVRRNAGENADYEIPIVFQSRKDYFDLPNKTQAGTVIQAYYSRQEPAGSMYVWNTPSSAVEYLNWTGERNIQIITGPDDTFDLPAEWYDAITYNLAVRLIPKFGCSPARVPLIKTDAKEYLDNALGFDQAVYPIRLKPQKYG